MVIVFVFTVKNRQAVLIEQNYGKIYMRYHEISTSSISFERKHDKIDMYPNIINIIKYLT